MAANFLILFKRHYCHSFSHLTYYSFIFYQSFWSYWYFVWAVSPLPLWASIGNYIFHQVSQGSDLCPAHSSARLKWSGPSDQWILFPTENCLQCQKWTPKEAEQPYLCPFVSIRREVAKPVPTKAFLHLAKAAVNSTPCWNLPTSPCPTFICSHKIKTYLKAYYTELATNEIDHSQMNLTLTWVVVNEIQKFLKLWWIIQIIVKISLN